MGRFNRERAETFGTYTVSALVRDAAERETVFVRISRKDLTAALGMSKLHDEHIATVRDAVARENIGMADMTAYFLFFYDDITEWTETAGAKALVTITDHFMRLSTDAANESWEDRSYLPRPEPKGRSKRRVVAEAVKEKSRATRLRG